MRTVIQPATAWASSPSRPSGRPIPGPTDSTGKSSTTGRAKGNRPARPKTTASRLAATATAPIPPTAAVSAASPVGTGRLGNRSTQSPPSVTPPEAEPAPTVSEDMMLAEQVEALTDTVRRLRVDVDALRSRAPSEEPPQPDRESALRPSGATDDPESTGAGEPLEEDAMLPEAGMGGRYQPWNEDEPAQSSRGAQAAVPSDEAMSAAGEPIKIAEVHFDSGSAQLTPGGERRTLDAIARIRSMAPAKVRVVAFTDRVGDSAYNLVLSKERALAVAAVLERTGLPREMVEVVGSGEEGVPVPTPDGVPEPLNRSAGIFVVRDATG